MNETAAPNKTECPRSDIAAYVDGELAAADEMTLEMHLVGCAVCGAELNRQKQFHRALDFALENENEIALPADFTKTVVARAESGVSGLRRASERSLALFICVALFLLVVVGFGRETETVLVSSGTVIDRFLVVGTFFTHLIYDVALGATVILRSLCAQMIARSASSSSIILFVFASSVLAFSGLIFRLKR